MAQKRMIDKKISVSEQVANLTVAGQLIYTWGMPHADDIGLLPSSHRTLKATIAPMLDIGLQEFTGIVEAIVREGLWEEFEHADQRFYRVRNFTRYQTLKKDRQPQIILQVDLCQHPADSWAKLNELGFQTEDNGIHLETEEKRREEKRREDNTNTSAVADSTKLEEIDLELSRLLLDFIRENTPTFKQPNLEKWAEYIRLMRERDGRTEAQIRFLITWCQKDPFWQANILSTKKLRDKFDTLVAQVKRRSIIKPKGKSIV
jgi:hypothetical protein